MSNDASHLQCLCGTIHESASLLSAKSFPIETELCHCNICRHCSGVLGGTFARLTGPPSKISLDACTRYSRAGGRVDRYFCSKCGTRIFDHATNSDNWYACSGVIEPKSTEPHQNVMKITSHGYVADTIDGGWAFSMQRLGGRDIPYYAGVPDLDQPGMTAQDIAELSRSSKQKSTSRNDNDRLFASCQCGSVKFHVRPPHPDRNKIQDLGEWLRVDGTKYVGLNCACRYCRLALGFPVAANTYVMPENIVIRDSDSTEKPVFDYTSRDEQISDHTMSGASLQAALPALKFDFSSDGIRRSFCGTCGASVFFERKSRPQVVNIIFGILRAESGAMATEVRSRDVLEGVCGR